MNNLSKSQTNVLVGSTTLRDSQAYSMSKAVRSKLIDFILIIYN